MLSTPIPSTEESRANAAFEALIWAMSRPGQVQILPEPREAPLIEALLDRECRVFSADPLLIPKVMESGAVITEVSRADHVFLGALNDLTVLPLLRMGSDLYPDEGATVVIRARFDAGPELQLSGPGIETRQPLQIGGLPEGFWRLRRDLIRYPMGFDLMFVDGDGVIGLPRSSVVENVEEI